MTAARRPKFAVGLDGRVYISIFELDGVDSLSDVTTLLESGTLFFIGVPLKSAERRTLLRHLDDGASEASGFIAGGRHWGSSG